MNKLLGIVAVAAVGMAVGGWMMQRGSDSATAVQMPPIANSAQAQTSASEIDTSRVIEMSVGDPDAPVTILEFASLTCPHCANFNQGVYRQLVDTYVDTGVVRIVKREVFFDAFGLWAAMVARCGGPERFHGIIDMLYQHQSDWSRAQPASGQSEAEAVADALRRIGRRAGLNNDELNACLEDRDMALAMMEVYRQGAEQYGITSTPSFVINGRRYSNMSFEDFSAAIAAAQR